MIADRIFSISRTMIVSILAVICLINAGCSIPTLETSDCTVARESVKRFYSFHFGNDLTPSPENLTMRKDFLTPEYYQRLTNSVESKTDVFTLTDNYPKAFRVGECRSADAGKAIVQVLLFWHTDDQNVQKQINVELTRAGDKWLVENVSK